MPKKSNKKYKKGNKTGTGSNQDFDKLLQDTQNTLNQSTQHQQREEGNTIQSVLQNIQSKLNFGSNFYLFVLAILITAGLIVAGYKLSPDVNEWWINQNSTIYPIVIDKSGYHFATTIPFRTVKWNENTLSCYDPQSKNLTCEITDSIQFKEETFIVDIGAGYTIYSSQKNERNSKKISKHAPIKSREVVSFGWLGEDIGGPLCPFRVSGQHRVHLLGNLMLMQQCDQLQVNQAPYWMRCGPLQPNTFHQRHPDLYDSYVSDHIKIPQKSWFDNINIFYEPGDYDYDEEEIEEISRELSRLNRIEAKQKPLRLIKDAFIILVWLFIEIILGYLAYICLVEAIRLRKAKDINPKISNMNGKSTVEALIKSHNDILQYNIALMQKIESILEDKEDKEDNGIQTGGIEYDSENDNGTNSFTTNRLTRRRQKKISTMDRF